MPVRLTSRQYRELAIAVGVAAISLLIALKYFSHAFPEAAIRFRVSRAQSRLIAKSFLTERGFNLKSYRHAAVFSFDDTAKLYLERTQGLAKMDRLTRGPIHLWRWSHRWFKPQQEEQFRVDVTPEGQVVGFSHEIPEAAAGANLSEDQARKIAEQFLTGAMHCSLQDLEFIEAERNKRPQRTDYAFTWKQKSVNLGGGSLRVEVSVDGNQPAGYAEYVKVPQAWSRSYTNLRSRNDTAQEVDQIFWALLWVAMLVILVRRLRDRDVPFRLSIAFGAVATVLYFLSRLNNFPLAKFSFSTTSSYSSFLTSYAFEAVTSALGVGGVIFLVVASSEPMYREAFPGKVSLRRYFTWDGLRSRSFFMASAVGVCLAAFFFAYQTVFYLMANRLGAWAPSDLPFSNMLNTRIPWAAVLFIGFFPAVNEELQFRAFAIPFLRKLTHSWPLALALAAFNWGFLHSAYPNQPFFIRGVEVGLGGIVVGLIMLRFGILCTMIWHYSVDALYTAFLLLRSPNSYYVITGGFAAGIMLVPLGTALFAYLAKGSFSDEAGLTNESVGVRRLPQAEIAAEAGSLPRYQALSRKKIWLAAAVVAASVGLWFVKVYHLGEGLRVGITRSQAVQEARAYLNQRHINVAAYHTSAWLDLNMDPLAVEYMSERLPVRRVGQVLDQSTQFWLWEVRFFRPLHQGERLVFVNAVNGKVFGYRELLNEDAPGATLTPQQALALGEQAVKEHGYPLAGFVLQASQAIKRKSREDYLLIWQAKPGDPRNVDRAHYRLEVDIAGDRVIGFARAFKLPEQWLREQSSRGLANSILLGLEFVLGAGIVAGVVWLFVVRVRAGALRWWPSLKVTLALLCLLILFALNSIPLLEQAYNTSISLEDFFVQVAVSYIFIGIAAAAAIWCLTALVTSLYPEAWGIFRRASRSVWKRDAAICAAIVVALHPGLSRLLGLLANHLHRYVTPGFAAPPGQLGAFSPALDGITGALLYATIGSVVAGICIYGISLGWMKRTWWFWLGCALVLAGLGPDGAHSPAEYGADWVIRFIPLAITVLIVLAFFRNNPLAYFTAIFCSYIVGQVLMLLSQPVATYRWSGIALLAMAVLVLAWLLYPSRNRREPDSTPSPSLT